MLGVKVVASNAYFLFKPSKLLKNLVNYKANRDNIGFALFFALTNATYKFLLCFLRRYLKNDK